VEQEKELRSNPLLNISTPLVLLLSAIVNYLYIPFLSPSNRYSAVIHLRKRNSKSSSSSKFAILRCSGFNVDIKSSMYWSSISKFSLWAVSFLNLFHGIYGKLIPFLCLTTIYD
jgi:hypothetical protein